MNVSRAREILELPYDFDETTLKRNYKLLAMKYHPDKNKDPDSSERFKEISAAHNFLLKNHNNQDNNHQVFTNIFKTFTESFVFKRFTKNEYTINLTAKEYFTGATKYIYTQSDCNCEKKMCENCTGCGFGLSGLCMECTGDGYTQGCVQCQDNPKPVKIGPKPKQEIFYPNVGKIKIIIDSPYFLKNGTLYYTYDISLKQSLTGFNLTFKDPFDQMHEIVTTRVVKSNDGYRLICNDIPLVLVFNVVYPKELSRDIIETLKELDF
jgi:hypothetical protein